jgi:hypothetical protein
MSLAALRHASQTLACGLSAKREARPSRRPRLASLVPALFLLMATAPPSADAASPLYRLAHPDGRNLLTSS